MRTKNGTKYFSSCLQGECERAPNKATYSQHGDKTKEGDKVAKYALGRLKESRSQLCFEGRAERRTGVAHPYRRRGNFITDPFDGIEGGQDVLRFFRGTVCTQHHQKLLFSHCSENIKPYSFSFSSTYFRVYILLPLINVN